MQQPSETSSDSRADLSTARPPTFVRYEAEAAKVASIDPDVIEIESLPTRYPSITDSTSVSKSVISDASWV
jgi:hypothetical protein